MRDEGPEKRGCPQEEGAPGSVARKEDGAHGEKEGAVDDG